MSSIKSWFSSAPFRYRRIEDSDLDAKLLLKDVSSWQSSKVDDSVAHSRRPERRKSWPSRILSAGLLLLGLLNLLLLASNIAVHQKLRRHFELSPSLSPTFDDFPGRTKPVPWDLRFYTVLDDPDHIYRQLPSQKVDEAWESLTEIDNILVDREDIERAGVPIESAVRVPASLNVTGEKYLAALDSIHQLHCLDAVRKSLFKEWYYPPGGSTSPYYMPHLMHCFDVVRQSLMCHSNSDILVYAWVEAQDAPFMPPKINHQCTDFKAIQRWSKQHKISGDTWKQFKKPADAVPFPMQREWYDLIPAVKEHMKEHPELYSSPDDKEIGAEHGIHHHQS